MNQESATKLTTEIRNEASKEHAAFPQYAGHWDGPEWKLYIVRKLVKSKLGIAFLRGEVVLAKEENIPELGGVRIVAYSRSNRVNTVLKPSDAALYQAS